MQTQKLYYEDPEKRSFLATVTGCEAAKGGYLVTLDATAFYPEGGGQPCDLGRLGDVRVLDVREKDAEIYHLCEAPLEVGRQVMGMVDWDRRLDLMQQHTGEHMVSGVINQLFDAHNVGFHLGNDVITIDFDVPIPADALPMIEERVNRGIFADLPLRCWYPSPEELPSVRYRSKKELPWPVRIVQVPGYDSCACCGVHVKSTGQVGLVKLLSCVKFHQGVRIEMVCGGRAVALFSRIYEQNRLVSQAFSAKLLETGAAAQKMNELLAAEKFRATGLERQLFARIAGDYAGAGNVVHFEEAMEPGALRSLAEQIALQAGGRAAVLSPREDGGYNVVLAHPGADVAAEGKAMNQALNGRGGGKPGFFQGSLKADRAAIEAFFAKK